MGLVPNWDAVLGKRPERRGMEIIAEVGLAHDGSMQAAHAYIDACAAAGVDVVKFQCHDGDPNTEWRVRPRWSLEKRSAYWKRTGFTLEQWADLAYHCDKAGVEFMCSVFSVQALKVINPLLKRHKIPSGRVRDLELLRAVADTKKPVLLSLGMATAQEVDAALNALGLGGGWHAGSDVSLLLCVTEYPTKPEHIDLRRLESLSGLSDHSGTIYPGLAAAALGCKVLEVHVCFSKEQGNLDAAASLTIEQLRQLVEGVRFIEKAMQPVDKDKLAAELAETRRVFM